MTHSIIPKMKVPTADLLLRPDAEMLKLYQLLLSSAYCRSLPKHCHSIGETYNPGHLYLIENGNFEIIRRSDGLRMGTGHGPAVIGLQELFSSPSNYYVKLFEDSPVYIVPCNNARKCIDVNGAWETVACILAYYLRRAANRDENMVSKDIYQIICYRIYEYIKHQEQHALNKTGIVKYITGSTSISRSQVYAIISNLKKGGYIDVVKGKLIKVNHLPDKY